MKWIAIIALAGAAASAQDMVKFEFAGTRVEFDGKTITGAPYSAQAVTETTQVLPDGNRITRKMSSLVARDGQGRTRREQNFDSVGPWAASAKMAPVVFVNDPVAGTRYRLETGSHVATRITMASIELHVRQEMETQARVKKEAERLAFTTEPRNMAKKESLGTQVMEGVQVEGVRITETIPAGTIGNDRPIEIVNERWTSPELQTVIMSKHSDPRVGDVTYTLTNLSRAEPDPALFTVPADYSVREEGPSEMKRIQDRRP